MSDLALKNASAQRDRLASKINQINQQLHDLRAELKSVDEWIAGWHRFAASHSELSEISDAGPEHSQNVELPTIAESVDSAGTERTRTTGNPKKELVAATARRIIEQAGQPVSRTDLFKELGNVGIHVEGKDPEQVLSTMLWRTRHAVPIVRLKSGGYWLTEEPYPPADYVPERDGTDVAQIVSTTAVADYIEGAAREERELEELKEQISMVDRLYAKGEDPGMSNEEYDRKRRRLEELT